MVRRPLLALFMAFGLLMPMAAAGGLPYARGASPSAFSNPQFEQTWARTDLPVTTGTASRSWLWGPQPGVARTEPFAGAPGDTRAVQYFDKARMEVNSAGGSAAGQWATTTGLLVVELVSGRVQTGPTTFESRGSAALPVAGDAVSAQDTNAPLYSSFRDVASLPNGPDRKAAPAPGALVTATINRAGVVGGPAQSDVRYSNYSPETGHNIPDVFLKFMQSRGPIFEGGAVNEGPLMDPVYVLGYPISEAYWATVPVGGKPMQVLVQLYQRRVLTYIPGYSPEW